MANPLKILSLLTLIAASFFYPCSCVERSTDGMDSGVQEPGNQTYHAIQAVLESSGKTIDYDGLMRVYNTMVQSKHRIPHMDQLLYALIDKRNENPRVDQMILIFSARAIGNSQYQIPHAYDLFEKILKQNNNRINEWVISFVAACIGRYPFDIHKGDSLIDFLELRQDQVAASKSSDPEEFFGFHFLPPPRNAYIVAYLENIEEQHIREFERTHYYSLIQKNITENEIATQLKNIRENGIPGTVEPCGQPLEYLLINMNSLFTGTENNAGKND